MRSPFPPAGRSFPTTKRFTAAIEILNGLEGKALARILQRLLRALPDKGVGSFTEEEREQMRTLFELNAAQLDLLLGSCAFILEQAAYATTPPESLRTELEGAGMAEGPAHAFSATWQTGASECVARLKEKSVLAPLQLSSVDWQLCVGTAGGGGEKGQAAHALLQLELAATAADGDAAGVAPGSRSIHLRMGREELSTLLGKLDTIQTQLDRLA